MKQKLMRIMTLIFVVALVFVMACPAFATDTGVLTGVYDFTGLTVTQPSFGGVYEVSFRTRTDTENPFNWISINFDDSAGLRGKFVNSNGDPINVLLFYWDKPVDTLDCKLCFDNPVTVPLDVANWFEQYREKNDTGSGEANTCTVSGVYQLKQPFTLEGFDFDVTFSTPVKLYSGQQTYTEYSSVSMTDDKLMLRFYGNTDNGNSGVTGETYIGIKSETVTYIDFGSAPQEVSEVFCNWLGGNASFFRQVPSLTQVVSTSALEMVMTEVVAILPVGVTFLVGYLALRKALRVLERVLYQA